MFKRFWSLGGIGGRIPDWRMHVSQALELHRHERSVVDRAMVLQQQVADCATPSGLSTPRSQASVSGSLSGRMTPSRA